MAAAVGVGDRWKVTHHRWLCNVYIYIFYFQDYLGIGATIPTCMQIFTESAHWADSVS